MLYQTEVYAVSHTPVAGPPLKSHHSHGSQASHTSYAGSSSRASSSHPRSSSHTFHPSSSSHASYPGTSSYASSKPAATTKRWGDRPVLLLLGIRLGLDGVNPVYYETIKMLYTLPQSVGIAGRRPSSSYYFVGVQGDGLFYLDPHHSRPAVPLRPPPTPLAHFASSTSEPPASRAGSQEPRVGSLEPRAGSFQLARAASPPMTEDELVLNAQRAEDVSGMTRAEAAFYQRASERARPEYAPGLCVPRRGGVGGLAAALLPRTIFVIQDEPPTWPGADDDDDMGLGSVSGPEEARGGGHGGGPRRADYAAADHDTLGRERRPKAQDAAGTAGSLPEEDGFVDVDAGRKDDIEDDRVDPVSPPPVAAPAPVKKSKSASGKGKEGKEEKEKEKKKRSKTKKAAAVHVPSVHYPFPVSHQQQRAEERERERHRNVTVSHRPTAQGRNEGQRMHTARARDGGCTQSGGVRGVLTADD
ncbi:hypothetical protein C8J57DRAFT_1615298 [Mycena rebaudengoi]|nr:hypothetical protein C8J57DRAFT_1615298 [Mycena rebaudengoi]